MKGSLFNIEDVPSRSLQVKFLLPKLQAIILLDAIFLQEKLTHLIHLSQGTAHLRHIVSFLVPLESESTVLFKICRTDAPISQILNHLFVPLFFITPASKTTFYSRASIVHCSENPIDLDLRPVQFFKFKAEQITCLAISCTTDYFNVWLNLSQTFVGNDNNYQVKKNTLQPGVVAILIRLRPTDWYDKPCMRLEVYGEPDLERGNCYCC